MILHDQLSCQNTPSFFHCKKLVFFLGNFKTISVVLNVSAVKAAPSLKVTSAISQGTSKSLKVPLRQFDLRSIGLISKKVKFFSDP